VEYNALNDTYSKLILDELLPELAKEYKISADPNDRAIAGASSGAICAFTVAWERPDQFRKVISTIGSFTNIMGGHVYPDLVRQNDPKPIRVFLQDGLSDNRGRLGRRGGYDPNWDWHAQNRKMVEALTEKKYDVNFTWGIGTHSNKQGGAIMPDMLRWLWRDYPRPDDPQDESNRKLLVPVADAKAPVNKPEQNADDERVPDDVSIQYNVRYREGTVNNWTMDLAMPKERSEKPRPAIVIIHGGGWLEGDKSSFSTPRANRPPGNIIDFTRLGFVAATVNYRLSGEALWPAAYHDCRCAVRFLRAHAKEYGIDPERIGAWGNSAGGHLALMLGMAGVDAIPGDDGPYQNESGAVQAVVSDSGPIDLVHQFHHNQVRTGIERLLGGPPEGARMAEYQHASPGNYVSGKLPPLMLIYGEADAQVGVETSDQFAEALQKAGLSDLTYLRLGKVDHCPHSLIRVPWLVPAVNEFFVRTLKGENASK
jgi:acetyl esterase/lipase